MYHKAKAMESLGRFNDSLYYYDQILEMTSEYTLNLVQHASQLYELGEYERSVAVCDAVLEVEPDNAPVWYQKGLAYDS